MVYSDPMEPDEFRCLREELGLTQAQLAERLGVTTVALWRWEKGQTPGSRRGIPEPVARLLRILAAHPNLVRELAASPVMAAPRTAAPARKGRGRKGMKASFRTPAGAARPREARREGGR